MSRCHLLAGLWKLTCDFVEEYNRMLVDAMEDAGDLADVRERAERNAVLLSRKAEAISFF